MNIDYGVRRAHRRMQTILVIAFISSMLLVSACSQEPSAISKQPAPVRDEPSLAIPATFINVGIFSEGLAPVQTQANPDRWGFISADGKQAIKAEFDSAGPFSEGLAAACIGGKQGRCGYIDKSGVFQIGPGFLLSYDQGFLSGLAVAGIRNSNEDLYGLVDHNGKFVVPAEHNWITRNQDGSYSAENWGLNKRREEAFLFDPTGSLIIRLPNVTSIRQYSEGLAPVAIGPPFSAKWGFVNNKGQFVIPAQYRNVSAFQDGIATVDTATNVSGVLAAPRVGLIDSTGKFISPPVLGWTGPFSNGLADVTIGDGDDSRSGYINNKGKFVINPTLAFADKFSEGLALISTGAHNYAYIDVSGQIVIAGPFVDGHRFKDGQATVAKKVNNKVLWGVIDRNGKVIVPFISDEAIEFHDGFAAVKRGDRFGFIRQPPQTQENGQ